MTTSTSKTTTPNQKEQLWKHLGTIIPPDSSHSVHSNACVKVIIIIIICVHTKYRLDPELLRLYIALVESSTYKDILPEVIPLVTLALETSTIALHCQAMAKALLHCPISTSNVMTEQLNAIMDLYRNDDADDDATINESPSSSHQDHHTFEELKLLEFFQSQRKVLQQ
jgi:hypothetical protein